MKKKELIAALIPVLELLQLLIFTLADALDKLSTYTCSKEEYEASRKRMIRYFRWMDLWH